MSDDLPGPSPSSGRGGCLGLDSLKGSVPSLCPYLPWLPAPPVWLYWVLTSILVKTLKNSWKYSFRVICENCMPCGYLSGQIFEPYLVKAIENCDIIRCFMKSTLYRKIYSHYYVAFLHFESKYYCISWSGWATISLIENISKTAIST